VHTRFDDEIQEADVVEGGDLAWLIGFNVGIDQETHVGFVGLEVEIFSRCQADHLPPIKSLIALLRHSGGLTGSVSSFW
jgi:hypothetical protein